MRFMKHRREPSHKDDDPLSGVANLFDVAMIFAVGLLVNDEGNKKVIGLMSSCNEMLRK